MDKHKLYTGGPLVDDLLARVEQLEKEKAQLEAIIKRMDRQLQSLRDSCAYGGICVY